MSALSELLIKANTTRLSARAIARQAQAAGHRINHDTAARYLRGDHGQPDEVTLRAFASVLPVGLAELRAAARLPAEEVEPYQPPVEASRLTRRQRRAVDEIIRAMLEPATSAAPEPGVAPLRPAARQPPRAARRGEAEPPER